MMGSRHRLIGAASATMVSAYLMPTNPLVLGASFVLGAGLMSPEIRLPFNISKKMDFDTKTAISKAVVIGLMILIISFFDEYLYILAPTIGGMGAMFPDIDHDNSKLGKKRSKVTSFVKGVLLCIMLVFICRICYLAVTGDGTKAFTETLTVILPVCIIYVVSTNQYVSNNIKFMTKHRGIMHTLIVPACIMYGIPFMEYEYVKYIMLMTAVGYLSHILADMLTKAGAPVLFPLSKSSISCLSIQTNTTAEVVVAYGIVAVLLYNTARIGGYFG